MATTECFDTVESSATIGLIEPIEPIDTIETVALIGDVACVALSQLRIYW